MAARPLLLVTLDGYAVEGGFDRPYEPATCFSPTVALGRHAGPGVADGLWRDYEKVLDLAGDLGLDGVRLTVEWTRVEPHRGQVNEEALDRYAALVRHAKARGLHVTIALVGAVWPAWLGLEAWLLPWVASAFEVHARRVVERLDQDIDGVIVFSDAEHLVRSGYLEGSAPPWRRGAKNDATFARLQLQRLCQMLEEDPVVGPRVVNRTLTVELESDAFFEARRTSGYDEIYVRSLVKGTGPTAARSGLLAKHNGTWTAVASVAVLEALR